MRKPYTFLLLLVGCTCTGQDTGNAKVDPPNLGAAISKLQHREKNEATIEAIQQSIDRLASSQVRHAAADALHELDQVSFNSMICLVEWESNSGYKSLVVGKNVAAYIKETMPNREDEISSIQKPKKFSITFTELSKKKTNHLIFLSSLVKDYSGNAQLFGYEIVSYFITVWNSDRSHSTHVVYGLNFVFDLDRASRYDFIDENDLLFYKSCLMSAILFQETMSLFGSYGGHKNRLGVFSNN